MDAAPILARVARLLDQHGLEAILIGNAAAALHGAPVTTIDLDFLFRKTPVNLRKLKAIAAELAAVILQPYYPVSGLYRIMRDEDGLQIDFMTVIHGAGPFEGLRRRAKTVQFGDVTLKVASLADISWSEPLKKSRVTKKAKLEALQKESDLALRDQIRRLLALPPERRTHFLRKRIGLRMSCL